MNVISFKCYETIIISTSIYMKNKIIVKIKDFCYEHNDPVQMREYICAAFKAHPNYAKEIKDTVLHICPQYKDMIEKLMLLI